MVKVGFTRDICTRMRALQTANAHTLVLEHLVATLDHRQMERMLHEYLTELGQHVRGEWFVIEAGTDYADVVRKARSWASFNIDNFDPEVLHRCTRQPSAALPA